MQAARSADGTEIAFEIIGHGPPVILIGGAFCDRRARTAGKPLAHELSGSYSVYCFDRRGRGQSNDTAPYAVAREVEDVAALIAAAGGRARVYGHSSGAVLAFEAAAAGLGVDQLALYEPPIVLPELRELPGLDFARQLSALVAEGRRSEACELFLRRAVAVQSHVIDQMKAAPVWANLQQLAHTLAYDAHITADASSLLRRAQGVSVPSLVMDGQRSPPWMRGGVERLYRALPQARYRSFADQDHDVSVKVLAPALLEFFAS